MNATKKPILSSCSSDVPPIGSSAYISGRPVTSDGVLIEQVTGTSPHDVLEKLLFPHAVSSGNEGALSPFVSVGSINVAGGAVAGVVGEYCHHRQAVSAKSNYSDILEQKFQEFNGCSTKGNQDRFLDSLLSQEKIKKGSLEAQEITSYFYNRASNTLPSWEKIARKSGRPENFNKYFSLSDLEQTWSVKGGYSTSATSTSPLFLACLKDSLEKSFSQRYEHLLSKNLEDRKIAPSSVEYERVSCNAQTDLESITTQLKKTLDNPFIPLSHAVQVANQRMFYHLAELMDQVSNKSPQFIRQDDGWTVIQPAPHLENLVFSGGGVKGVGYIGFLKAAQAAGILKYVERVAGSSAGAITASFIAAGMNAEDIETAMLEIGVLKQLSAPVSHPVIDSADSHHKYYSAMGLSSGKYLEEQINLHITRSIHKYFSSLCINELNEKTREMQFTETDKNSLSALKDNICENASQGTYLVTFEDLSLLRKLDHRFKELIVTAYDKIDKKMLYYQDSFEGHPDLSIAEAAAISAALPVVFRGRKDKTTGNLVQDGAIGSNIPAQVFQEQPNAKTLVLAFDQKGQFDKIVHGDPALVNSKPNIWETMLSGNPHFRERTEQDAANLRNAGPNAFNVRHGVLGSTSFTASQKQLFEAICEAEMHAWQQLELRQRQGIYDSFETLEAAMQKMTDQELEDIQTSYASEVNEKETLSKQDRLQIVNLAKAEIDNRRLSKIEAGVAKQAGGATDSRVVP